MNAQEKVERFMQNEPLFDQLMNSSDLSYLDLNQRVRYTWNGIEKAFQDSLSTWGKQELGDWKIGLVVRARNEVVLYDNFLYRFDGQLPHTINGSNPTEDSGDWVNFGNRDDALLVSRNLSDVKDKAKAQTNLEVFPNKGLLGTTTDLNTLSRAVNVGIYAQVNNTNATLDRNYPVPLAGTLFVTASAFDGQQMYITYTGRFFFRGQTSFNVWGNWQELANLSVANVFTGSQTSIANGVNFIARAKTQGGATYYSIKDADGSDIGYVGKGGPYYDVSIFNQKSGLYLTLKEDGRMLYSDNEVLHTGNTNLLPMLGVDQTWQDVKASRNKEVTYTNNTGKPIQIVVTQTGASTYLKISVNNIMHSESPVLSVVIPDGATYKIEGSGSINQWKELR